ncbi:MAG: A/G-specific adenine glycosylase [Gammaproteobacteria bacterium]|nr:A/G-specific adenine glycosylase [Gammaproteobacteria bacterium]
MTAAGSFAARLLSWHARYGRHDLPWQQPRAPYRVWVAEIMLQQTQVATAIPYFQRFIERFPDVHSLAAASSDQVLAVWSGLGYYARARNLHRAAQQLAAHGEWPQTLDGWMALPGIGRSTAGAILAQAFGRRQPMLDGNARRVFARHAGVVGWPGEPAVAAKLWREAQARLPRSRLADYTQAVMDLGASLCTARGPACGRCPVAADCRANIEGRQQRLPTPRPRRARPQRSAWLLLIDDGAERWWLQRRPPAGIWGGLWCVPLIDQTEPLPPGLELRYAEPLPAIEHAFTHFALTLQPLRLRVRPAALAEGDGEWLTLCEALARGLPAPLRKLFESLKPRRISMPRIVHCIKLGSDAEGLDRAPLPGELGRRIYEQVSKQAWQQWLQQQTRLINEYQLVLADPAARKFLSEQAEAWFFGDGQLAATHYKPPSDA